MIFTFVDEGNSPVDSLVPVCSYPVRESCQSIFRYGNILYVGALGGLDLLKCNNSRFPDNRMLFPPLKSSEPRICCVRADRSRVYTLHQKESYHCIVEYDIVKEMGLQFVWKWDIEDSPETNQFAIYDGKIYLPIRRNNHIFCFTLREDLEKVETTIPLTLADSSTCVAVTSKGHMLISQFSPSLLVCADLEAKIELWRVTDVSQPQGITADSYCKHFLVYTATSDPTLRSIEVRKVETGKLIFITTSFQAMHGILLIQHVL